MKRINPLLTANNPAPILSEALLLFNEEVKNPKTKGIQKLAVLWSSDLLLPGYGSPLCHDHRGLEWIPAQVLVTSSGKGHFQPKHKLRPRLIAVPPKATRVFFSHFPDFREWDCTSGDHERGLLAREEEPAGSPCYMFWWLPLRLRPVSLIQNGMSVGEGCVRG